MEKIRKRTSGAADGTGLLSAKHESLTALIPDLEKSAYGRMTEPRGDGTAENPLTFPVVDYCPEIVNLEKAVYEYVNAHPEEGLTDYGRILEESGLKWNAVSMENADVSKLDGRTVMALLTGAFRAERFSGGIVLAFCRSGAVLRWLKRLKETDGSGTA